MAPITCVQVVQRAPRSHRRRHLNDRLVVVGHVADRPPEPVAPGHLTVRAVVLWTAAQQQVGAERNARTSVSMASGGVAASLTREGGGGDSGAVDGGCAVVRVYCMAAAPRLCCRTA